MDLKNNNSLQAMRTSRACGLAVSDGRYRFTVRTDNVLLKQLLEGCFIQRTFAATTSTLISLMTFSLSSHPYANRYAQRRDQRFTSRSSGVECGLLQVATGLLEGDPCRT